MTAMKDRFTNTLYTIEVRRFIDHHNRYLRNDDGTLFSGNHKTKILSEDLPEWYVYGRYYKCWGYMSTKGIKDMLYVPNKFTNHFLKDDCLYVSYHGAIAKKDKSLYYERYTGYDEMIWGSEIIGILKGAREYSDYDISDFIVQLKEKKEWLAYEYPGEFGLQRWNFDVDDCFQRPFDNGRNRQ